MKTATDWPPAAADVLAWLSGLGDTGAAVRAALLAMRPLPVNWRGFAAGGAHGCASACPLAGALAKRFPPPQRGWSWQAGLRDAALCNTGAGAMLRVELPSACAEFVLGYDLEVAEARRPPRRTKKKG